MKDFKFKNDKYKKARGGYSRFLGIQCAKCNQHLFFYQKDGSGILKRMYLDRIFESNQYSNLEKIPLKSIPQLTCPKCNNLLGTPYVYEKEKRLAYRLFVGAITKKIVNQNKPINT